jgi:hypothetical protein
MILSDLRPDFPTAPEKRGDLSETQVYAALNWLAHFHGFWWKDPSPLARSQMKLPPLQETLPQQQTPEARSGVWLNGGYTYLATRRTEYDSLARDTRSEWSAALCQPIHSTHSVAEIVAQLLAPAVTPGGSAISAYETLIHGDVKSENLFTTEDGTAVAFFDFQYTGLGLGVCDLAKLFTCSVPNHLLTRRELGIRSDEAMEMDGGEKALLEHYRRALEDASGKEYPWEILVAHWNAALVDWLRFQASWGKFLPSLGLRIVELMNVFRCLGFWGNTEWLEARVRHILKDQGWWDWVLQSV